MTTLETLQRTQSQAKQVTTEEGLPRNPRVKFHFKRQEFDFFFQWIVGMQTHGAVEIGEAYYVASQIEEGDVEGWIREWTAMSERVERRAKASQQRGHPVSAQEGYLRSYYYHRIPLLFISPLNKPERYRRRYEQARALFRTAINLFEKPVDTVEVPYEEHILPGYFFKATNDEAPRKTLVLIGGGDTFVEDLYAYLGPATLNRDYNLLIVDLPGQGILPFDGLVWPREAEKPVSAVIDYVLSRSDVDPDRLAIFGLSGGGHLVPRALTAEKRIKAGVACAAILDFSTVWNRDFVNLVKRAKSSLLHKLIKAYFSRRRKAYFTMVDTYVWRTGLESADQLIEGTQGYTVDPEKITCPFLNLVAQQEYDQSSGMMEAAHTISTKAPNPKNKTVIMPAEEGADSHGIGTNLSLLSQVTFDWLDEVLAQ